MSAFMESRADWSRGRKGARQKPQSTPLRVQPYFMALKMPIFTVASTRRLMARCQRRAVSMSPAAKACFAWRNRGAKRLTVVPMETASGYYLTDTPAPYQAAVFTAFGTLLL